MCAKRVTCYVFRAAYCVLRAGNISEVQPNKHFYAATSNQATAIIKGYCIDCNRYFLVIVSREPIFPDRPSKVSHSAITL